MFGVLVVDRRVLGKVVETQVLLQTVQLLLGDGLPQKFGRLADSSAQILSREHETLKYFRSLFLAETRGTDPFQVLVENKVHVGVVA